MEFVAQEVENDQSIELALNGFRNLKTDEKTSDKKTSNNQRGRRQEKDDIPTAAGLFSGISRMCIFCDKPHGSAECLGAKKMTLDERVEKAKEKRACFSCLKIGHSSRRCYSDVSCEICGGRHQAILCRDQKEKIQTAQNNLCNRPGGVVLPTLLAALVHGGERKMVRVLCDSGSTYSYIKRKTAKDMGLKSTGTVKYEHSLFGNKKFVENHEKFLIELEEVGPGARGKAKIEVLCQEEICGEVVRLPSGPWMKELEDKKIWLSDVGNGTGAEIEVLVGAEDYAYIQTGQSHKLNEKLMTVETSLGWAVFGRGNEKVNTKSDALISTSVSSSAVPKMESTVGAKKKRGPPYTVPWWMPASKGRDSGQAKKDTPRRAPWWEPARKQDVKKKDMPRRAAWWEPARKVQKDTPRRAAWWEPARKVQIDSPTPKTEVVGSTTAPKKTDPVVSEKEKPLEVGDIVRVNTRYRKRPVCEWPYGKIVERIEDGEDGSARVLLMTSGPITEGQHVMEKVKVQQSEPRIVYRPLRELHRAEPKKVGGNQ
jgi:hypothetical protein